MLLSFAAAVALSPAAPLPLPAASTLTTLPQDAIDAFVAGSVEVEGTTFPYRLLAPESIEAGSIEAGSIEAGERYPLVLFLHGAGERGGDNETQLTHFPVRMAESARRSQMPCFVLAPQCPSGERWSDVQWGAKDSEPMAAEPTLPLRAAMEALFEVVREQPVDTERIYLTGLSMGGYGSFDLALRHPDWFAAVAPVCGGGDERQAARLAGLPLSVWHGDADRAVPVERSRQMVAALRGLGQAPLYRELEGVGHNAWDFAYGDEGCLEWLFEQRRDPQRRLDAAAALMAGALAPDDRVAFLGDSITQSGANPGGYVDRLRTAIAAVQGEAEVIPAGISGHKVPDLLRREKADVRDKGATIVFTYIGINDVWHSRNGKGTPLDQYASGLGELLGRFEQANALNVVATPTLIGEAPEGRNDLDDMLAGHVGAARSAGSRAGRTLCDLHDAFRTHERIFNATGEAKGCLTTDGVHLNQAGNVLVATEAALTLYAAASSR